MKKRVKFPKRFLWGTATSAIQVEGNNTNTDWWEWEQDNLKTTSGIACDSYNRFEEDFTLAKKFGHNAHRLSIEWARIEPIEGKFDQTKIDHYKRVLSSLVEKGIKPIVTLHHFSSPSWIRAKGGWFDRKMPALFAKYAKKCAFEFQNLVDIWITINEPSVYVEKVYGEGSWMGYGKNWLKVVPTYLNMIHAHNKSYSTIKEISPKSQVGLAMNTPYVQADGKNPLDLFLAKLLNQLTIGWYWTFVKHNDFIGLNYYNLLKIKNLKFSHDFSIGACEGYNWGISPEGIYFVLKELWKRYKKPILITENGVADAKDHTRKKFIHDHLANVHKAISEGANVLGYLYWSLIDNFEWHLGYEPKFGLIEIDRDDNLKRIPRPSCEYFGNICKTSCLSISSL